MSEECAFPYHERAFFNNEKTETTDVFVAWIDMMGAKKAFARGLPKAANFIAKMHDAIARSAPRSGCDVVPITDGAFLLARSQLTLRRCVDMTLYRLACSFINEDEPEHRFLVRCGIAFGEVVLGRDLAMGFHDPSEFAQHAHQAPLGTPISEAYEAERLAPAFGVFVTDSAAHKWGLKSAGTWPWWSDGLITQREAIQFGNEVAKYISSLTWDKKQEAASEAKRYFR